MKKIDGVFALDVIGKRFSETIDLLNETLPQKIITVGGTCGTEAGPVSYLNDYYKGDIAVIWFDAHGDLNTPESSPSGHFHGMVLRTLLGDGPDIFCNYIRKPLQDKQVFMAGIRDLDKIEHEYIDNSNITVCQVNKDLVDAILKAGFSKVYIHIDVDVLNPEDFSGMLMPTTGGPMREELSECLSLISENLDVIGVGVVEFCENNSESSQQLLKILNDGKIIKAKRVSPQL